MIFFEMTLYSDTDGKYQYFKIPVYGNVLLINKRAFNLYHTLGKFSRWQIYEETICMKCQSLFSGKNKENILNGYLLKCFTQHA